MTTNLHVVLRTDDSKCLVQTFDVEREIGAFLSVYVGRFVDRREDVDATGLKMFDLFGVSAHQVTSHGEGRYQRIASLEQQTVEQSVFDTRSRSKVESSGGLSVEDQSHER